MSDPIVTILGQTFLGPLVWLELMVDGVSLQACWPATGASGVGAEAWVTVRGRVGVFPAQPVRVATDRMPWMRPVGRWALDASTPSTPAASPPNRIVLRPPQRQS